jgi:hypothetical protein
MKQRVTAFSICLTIIVLVSSGVVYAADMFSGSWKLNIAKSTFGAGPAPKEPTVSRYELTPAGMKLTSQGTTSRGNAAHSEYVFKLDGKDYPGTQSLTIDGKPVERVTDQTISAKKIDDYTIEFTFKNKGTVTSHATAVISKDGKTETYTTTYTVDGQEKKNITIWEKQ